MPTPSYSPTDYGAAIGALVLMVLDVLTGLGVIPVLDSNTRHALMISVTFLAGLLIAAYANNRRIKHQTQATVVAAQVTAVPPSTAAATPQVSFGTGGSSFVVPPTTSSGTPPPTSTP